jgi:hypothetical protein
MNQVATILGLQLPSMKARDSVMSSKPIGSSSFSLFSVQDSLLMMNYKKLDDDADTVSTTSLSASDSSLSVDFNSVTFAEPLVTEVHFRPYTTRQEKQVLFYNERDYLEFKRDYYYGTTRNTLVKFAATVVSQVWTVPQHEDPSQVYYTEAELQQFLDEFVASLDKR